ncbi:MAG: pyridoxamine 5'-phosphate oxidase family protein [Gammaproteobacteria bacterium]
MEPLTDDLLHRVLDCMPVARLAVIDGEGRPEAMPIVFARVGRTLFSPIDGKPKKHGRPARIAHIERNPTVALVVDYYDEQWNQLWWIRLNANAAIAEGRHDEWDAAVEALRLKYPQYQTTPMFREHPVMICMTWDRMRWWAPEGASGLEAWLRAARGT